MSDPSSLAHKFVLSGAAGAAAELTTFPIDLIKTRLQLSVSLAISFLALRQQSSAGGFGL